jgi:hypothetical protein
LMACLPKPIDFSRLRVLIHEVLNEDQQGHSVQRGVRHPPHQPRSLQAHRSPHR